MSHHLADIITGFTISHQFGRCIYAGKVAFEKANHEYNDLYYQTLWNQTKGFTVKMIQGSSKSMAELITQAWIEAGRPHVPSEIKMPQ